MSCYAVYLELAEDGRCFAHVPSLPGCIVRAPTRGEALHQLPAAITDHHAWLRRHGEPTPEAGTEIRVEVADEFSNCGPFDAGSAAALFPPDREPVSVGDMERAFRLMAHSRADLLALSRHLPDDLLDWEPSPGSFSIRRVLRHVGNAEEWYVSRVVAAESLPPEWEHDTDLPLFDFLEMERRTAVARLRRLTDEERAGVFYPTVWTDHPDEAWTLRKVLRRFLEHEREHAGQVRQILNARRQWLLARLAAERAALLEQLLGLDERMLTGVPIAGDWSIKDLLAHIAAWDRWEERTMRSIAAGESPDLSALDDFDASNAAFIAPWRDRSLDEVLVGLDAARAEWLLWLEGLPEEEFFRPRTYGGHDWSFHTVPLRVQWEHDAEHGRQIVAWRRAAAVGESAGPRTVLSAALDAARVELLAAVALVPAEQHESRPVCGAWTLKDLLGHIADWEYFAADGLRLMASGQPPDVEPVHDIDAWNQVHAEARFDQPWEQVWEELYAARRGLLDALGGMAERDLVRSFPFPWGEQGTPYAWVRIFLGHDREHAEELRSGEAEEDHR